MEFEAEVTKQAYSEFVRHGQSRVLNSKGLRKKFFTVNIFHYTILGMGLAALLRFYEDCNECELWHLNLSLIFIVSWFVVGLLLHRWSVSQFINCSVSEPGTVLGRFTFRIDENGISEAARDYSSQYSWFAVQEISRQNGHLYAYVDTAKAVIIPVAELSTQQKAELDEIISGHMRANL